MHKDTRIRGTWRRAGTLTVFMQHTNFENFKLGPSAAEGRGTGSGKNQQFSDSGSKSVNSSRISPQSPTNAQREQVRHTEEQSLSVILPTKEEKASP